MDANNVTNETNAENKNKSSSRLMHKIRTVEVVLSCIGLFCSIYTVSTVRGIRFLLNAFEGSVFMRYALSSLSQIIRISTVDDTISIGFPSNGLADYRSIVKKSDIDSWIYSCYLGSFMMMMNGSMAVAHVVSGVTPVISFFQSMLGYLLCFILATDAVICSNKGIEKVVRTDLKEMFAKK